MIEKIIVENFGPFASKEEIDFTRDKEVKEYDEDYNIISGTDILKTVFFYGANNSGKSQTLKLFKLLKDIPELGSEIFEKSRYLPNIYKKNNLRNSLTERTEIEYFFNINNNKYSYRLIVCFYEKKIYIEELKKEQQIIFTRKEKKVNLSELEIDENIFYLTYQITKQGGNDDIRNVYEFIKKLGFIEGSKDYGNVDLGVFTSSQIQKLEKKLKEINEALKRFGFDFNLRIRTGKEDLGAEKKSVFVEKRGVGSKFGLLESYGTECFLKLLIEVYNVTSNTIIIDEIEKGLNFYLVANFLEYLNKFFNEKQIILATHMDNFLESDYRKDQFYITNIENCNLKISRELSSKLYRKTQNFRKLYKNGIIGGIPKIGENDD